MVEKNENDMIEETVMVEAITEAEELSSTKAAEGGSQFGPYTLGAAIEKFEANLPVQLTFPDAAGGQVTATSTTGNQTSRAGDAVCKLFMLRSLIEIGINAAILKRLATHGSIAYDCQDAKAGNVVSFRISPYFLEIREGKTCLNTLCTDSTLSFDNDSSRFFVIESGYSGRASFFHPIERRFLAWNTDGLVCCSAPITSMYDIPRYNETFLLCKNGTSFEFFGEKTCYFLFPSNNGATIRYFSMYKIVGFDS